MALCVLCLFLGAALNFSAAANPGRISGGILDPQGVAAARAHLKLMNSLGHIISRNRAVG
jgi:hypothetical protein